MSGVVDTRGRWHAFRYVVTRYEPGEVFTEHYRGSSLQGAREMFDEACLQCRYAGDRCWLTDTMYTKPLATYER